MGTKALFAVLYWLVSNEVFGDQGTVKSSVAIDNVSAESAPQLYRNVPAGVYASAAPYGSYSFHLPKLVAAPHMASSQNVPVQQATNNGVLKDSYGNRFAATPLTLAYKTAFPQKFLPLQKLPDHLAQPLVGASANFQFKQTAQVPQAIQVPTPTPLNHYAGFSQPLVYAEKIRSLTPTSVNHFASQTSQQQPNNNKAIFTNAEPYKNYKSYNEPKFQRIQDIPRIDYGQPNYHRVQEIPKLYNENKFQRLQDTPQVQREEHQFGRYEKIPANNQNDQHGVLDDNASLQAVPAKNTVTYVTDVNGKTTIVKLKTDPPIPLLDLTLLEPLTFENPLVPQVQHFLPRISQATYEKIPQVKSQPKNYDDSKDKTNTKKQKKPIHHSKPKAKSQTPVIRHETLDEVPEILYEINQPNYQETYKEKVLSYNKETTSAPETYSYGSKIENEPVTYSYSRNSAEPNNKEIRFEKPKHLIYNFTPEEQNHEEEEEENHPEEEEEESVSQNANSHEALDDDSYHHHPQHYKESTKSSDQQHDLKHKSKDYDQIQTLKEQQQYAPSDVEVFDAGKNSSPQKQQPEKEYEKIQPITREYEEDIRIAPTPSADIRINPDHHVQYEKPTQKPHSSPSPKHEEHSRAPDYHSHNSPAPQKHSHFSYSHPPHSHSSQLHSNPSLVSNSYQHYSTPESGYHKAPEARIHEKSQQIIIKEKTPEGLHMIAEKMKEEMIQREENSEEDFEKAYHDAAFGFPNYNSNLEVKKEIFNPASFGVPPEHIEYTIEHAPFEQYQDQHDDYPKATRMSYKDARDKTKEDYYAEYKVSQPESLNDHYRNKDSYYKLYRDNKPEYLNEDVEERKEKQKPKSAKYVVAPTHAYSSEHKPKSYYSSYQQPKQQLYDYNYHKPRDNTAFASRPLQMYKIKTNFVEPQFQYGFEPIAIPKLLDSELAAMSSNLNPESEKPGMRKKMYKENWYIKQTSMSAGDPAS